MFLFILLFRYYSSTGNTGAVASALLSEYEISTSCWLAFSDESACAEKMLNNTIDAAIVQVAFSRKSVVFLTPIIWFDDAKPEAKPPPFEF